MQSLKVLFLILAVSEKLSSLLGGVGAVEGIYFFVPLMGVFASTPTPLLTTLLMSFKPLRTMIFTFKCLSAGTGIWPKTIRLTVNG